MAVVDLFPLFDLALQHRCPSPRAEDKANALLKGVPTRCPASELSSMGASPHDIRLRPGTVPSHARHYPGTACPVTPSGRPWRVLIFAGHSGFLDPAHGVVLLPGDALGRRRSLRSHRARSAMPNPDTAFTRAFRRLSRKDGQDQQAVRKGNGGVSASQGSGWWPGRPQRRSVRTVARWASERRRNRRA